MKLFYVPGVCSLCADIVLREAAFEFTLDLVDVKNGKKTQSGDDFLRLNPKGYVPALLLDDGTVMTEVSVMIQYLADQKPALALFPPAGTMARYEAQGWLNFIATELHKGMSPFFNPAANAEFLTAWRTRLDGRFAMLADRLQDRPWVMGAAYSVVDAYAFYVLRMFQKQPAIRATLEGTLKAYYARLAARPAVVAALAAEGLEA